jgi:hypothetical protein
MLFRGGGRGKWKVRTVQTRKKEAMPPCSIYAKSKSIVRHLPIASHRQPCKQNSSSHLTTSSISRQGELRHNNL